MWWQDGQQDVQTREIRLIDAACLLDLLRSGDILPFTRRILEDAVGWILQRKSDVIFDYVIHELSTVLNEKLLIDRALILDGAEFPHRPLFVVV